MVWSILGAPGEKKRENQMYSQDWHTFTPLRIQILLDFHEFKILKKIGDLCRFYEICSEQAQIAAVFRRNFRGISPELEEFLRICSKAIKIS